MLIDGQGLSEIGMVAKILPVSDATAKDHEKLNLVQATISSHISTAQAAAAQAAQEKERAPADGPSMTARAQEAGPVPPAAEVAATQEQATPAQNNSGLTHL